MDQLIKMKNEVCYRAMLRFWTYSHLTFLNQIAKKQQELVGNLVCRTSTVLILVGTA